MKVVVDQAVPTYQSYAAVRTRGLYNISDDDGARFRLEVEVPVEDTDWQIGVITGPSGSGKSSVVRALAREGWTEWIGGNWPDDEPIIEAVGGSWARATATLSAVGLGAVPSWLRPYPVLSTGEKFRADMAQLLQTAEAGDQYLLDEFSSVMDRKVAQVAAGAFAKAWRRVSERRVILVSPHHDFIPWVQPEWVINTDAERHLDGNKGSLLRDKAVEGGSVVTYDGPVVGTLKWRVRNG